MAKKYSCNYAEQRGNIAHEEDGGVYCKITDKCCPVTSYIWPFGSELTGNMPECPAFNIPKELAQKLIQARLDNEKSKLEAKLDG